MRSLSLVLVAFVTLIVSAHCDAKERPNVIVVLADDLGFSDLGCYGSEIPTPNLDQLAANGSRFSAFYTSARCCPSRASLMTGLHPHQAGIGSFAYRNPRRGWGPAYTGHLLPTCVTMAETLRDGGYSTWMVGKWHMGIPGPIERGFQNYFGYKDFLAYAEDQWDPSQYVRFPGGTTPELKIASDEFYATDVFTDYALEFMRQARREDKPYFLYLAHSSPHFPVQAPRESIDKHMSTYRQGWDELRRGRFEKQKQSGLVPADAELPPLSEVPVDDPKVTNGFGGQPNPAWDSLEPARREDLARRGATFAAMVQHVDQGIGRIVADLQRNGELENTLLIFLSDNGACYEWGPFGFDGPSRRGITTLHTGDALAEFGQAGTNSSYGSGWANLGNTPLNMYKHFCHEGGIASPLVIHWPKRIPSRSDWVRRPAHLMDILPTVLDATGAKYPANRQGWQTTPIEGESLLPVIASETTGQRSLAFEHMSARGLRRGKWKLTWGKRQPTEPEWELYNLQTDRSEQHDLAPANPELVHELAAEWDAWAKRVGAAPFQKPDEPKLSGRIPEEETGKQVAERILEIEAVVGAESPAGVVIAQGGQRQGYAIHFAAGKPVFDVRINGQVTRLSYPHAVSGRLELSARLDEKTMTLTVAEGQTVRRESPGLIPTQPSDPLNVEQDELTSAGDYETPNRFSGKVISHHVKTYQRDRGLDR